MRCTSPLDGWYSSKRNPSGKRSIVFKKDEALLDRPVSVPCGQCTACRLERSRQWAVRCYHESQMHEHNCFITLTFAPEHIEARDKPFNLDHSEFQRFMKRLRKKYGDGIKFYQCGEYGDNFGRPHYHACLFGHDFEDKEYFGKSPSGYPLYTSPSLNALWPYGYSTVCAFSFETAAYTARYIMKKVNGKKAEDHYDYLDPITGELYQRQPEYNTMSRNPGIGKLWYDKYGKHSQENDIVIINEKASKPPKYYDSLFEAQFPHEYSKMKSKRVEKAKKRGINSDRLLAEKKYLDEKLKMLPRNLK